MRKIYTKYNPVRVGVILLAFTLGLFAAYSLKAQCAFTSSVQATASQVCVGQSIQLSVVADDPDSTLTSGPVAGNNQDGNMFNITVNSPLRIRYFEGHIMNTPSVTTPYYIYYKAGTHVGFEGNAGAWTLIGGPVTVTPNPQGTMTLIPIDVNLSLTAGTHAFYLTSDAGATSNNNHYHDGTSVGAVVSSNTDLSIHQGTGNAYPFSSTFSPRIWEGVIHYDHGPYTAVWSTGATTPSTTVTPSLGGNNYSVTVTYTTLGCTNTASTTITGVGAATPNLGNDTGFCEGGSTTLNPGSFNSYLWSTGATTSTLNVNTPGTYTVEVTDGTGCTGYDTVAISEYPNPVPGLDSATYLCGGNPTSLDPGTFAQYLWSTGATTPTLTVSASGAFTVTVTDANGCEGVDTTLVFTASAPQVNLGPDAILCPGQSLFLSAGNAGPSYLWSTGATSNSITVNTAGTYSVVATDGNGCTGGDTVVYTAGTTPSASFTHSGSGVVINFTNTSTGATSYIWDFGDGGNSTFQNPTHTYPSVGSYTVQLIAISPCDTDTFVTVVNVLVGLEAGLTDQFSLYPNPANDRVQLLADGIEAHTVNLQIQTLTGQAVYRSELPVQAGAVRHELQLDQLPAGVYIVRLGAEGRYVSKKLVLQ